MKPVYNKSTILEIDRTYKEEIKPKKKKKAFQELNEKYNKKSFRNNGFCGIKRG